MLVVLEVVDEVQKVPGDPKSNTSNQVFSTKKQGSIAFLFEIKHEQHAFSDSVG